MDAYDRERAHHQAKENARNMYDEQYSNQDQYDPNNTDMPQQFQTYGGRGGGQGGYGGDQGGYGGGQGGYGGGNY